jgi:hypothetical protein
MSSHVSRRALFPSTRPVPQGASAVSAQYVHKFRADFCLETSLDRHSAQVFDSRGTSPKRRERRT